MAALRHEVHRVDRIKRRQELAMDGLTRAMTKLRGRVVELEAFNRQLVGELDQLRAARRQ